MWAEERFSGVGLGRFVTVAEEEGSEGDGWGDKRRPKTPRLLSSMGWKSMRARRPP